MLLLILGLILFLGAHSLPTVPALRANLVSSMGENGFKGLMTVLSLVGFVLIVWGFGSYRGAGYIPLWNPPAGLRHLTILLMLFSFIALAASKGPPGNIRYRLKHPMLVAVKIWALAHLLANGDLGSVILFGAVLAWAVYDRISVKRRGAQLPPPPDPVHAVRNDVITVVIGVIAWGAMIALHPLLIGVPVIGG
jgi:uncharacterized membrane protein